MQGKLFGDEGRREEAQTFQAKASLQGRLVHQAAWDVLCGAGFELVAEHYELSSLGVEVNLVVRDKLGEKWFCEVTGAYEGRRPGLLRTDTVRKIVGSAQLLARWRFTPFLILTTHLPKPGSHGDRMLRATGPEAIFDVLVISEPRDWNRLHVYAAEGAGNGPGPGWWSGDEITSEFRPPYKKAPGLPGIQRGMDPLFEDDKPEQALRIERLAHHLEIDIPSRDSSGDLLARVDHERFVKDFYGWCLTRNGGLKHYTVNGLWDDSRGGVASEQVESVVSWSSRPFHPDELRPFIERMFHELDQEAVLFAIDGIAHIAHRAGSPRLNVETGVIGLPESGQTSPLLWGTDEDGEPS